MQDYANVYFKNFLLRNDKNGHLLRIWEKEEESKFIKTFPVMQVAKATKRKKAVGAPKSAISAYLHFVRDYNERAKKNGISLGKTLPMEASNKWKTLSENEKDKYTRLAEQDRERYKREMIEWKQKDLPFEEGDEEE